jgi:ATP-dependent exoDNAse (exonuclease V) beta subunit
LVNKYVENNFLLNFSNLYEYCDNFIYKDSFNEYRDSLEKSFNKIINIISDKRTQGFDVKSEYKIYYTKEDDISRIIVGKIDLLFIKDDTIEIVDVKTSNSNVDPSLNPSYVRQLNIYRNALVKQFDDKKISISF